MRIMNIESELEDACRRVCLNAQRRVELVDAVMEIVTEALEGESEPVSKLREAFETQAVQSQFDDVGITGYQIQDGDTFRVTFDRRFEGSNFHPDLVLSGRMCVLGRLASRIAQEALDGQAVAVVHTEDIVITGDKTTTIDTHVQKRKRDASGPYYPKQPDRIAKRSVRGMLPHKKSRGRKALERIRMYIGAPAPFDGEAKTPRGKRVALNPNKKKDYVSLGEISNHL